MGDTQDPGVKKSHTKPVIGTEERNRKEGRGARRLRGRGGQRAGGAAPRQLCGTLTVKTTYVYNCVKNKK